MKFNPNLKVFGDIDFRGKCPTETAEQSTFFNILRRKYPDTYGAVALHIKNEGKRTVQQLAKMKAEGGFIPGASDVVIPGSPTFVMELKRKDHTQSQWQKGQQEYLLTAQSLGCYVCIALGYEAALEAFEEWKNGK